MEGAVFAYHYDLNDRLGEEKRHSTGHTQGTGTWNYRYDCMGRLTERTGPDGQMEEWNVDSVLFIHYPLADQTVPQVVSP